MYVKLFSSILDSTIWAEGPETRIVWITMLAMADKDGDVRCSPSGLARRANVTPEAAHAAVEQLLAPDADSATPDYEGRRIEAQDGGWHILNYVKYREIQDREARKESWRKSSKRRAGLQLGDDWQGAGRFLRRQRCGTDDPRRAPRLLPTH